MLVNSKYVHRSKKCLRIQKNVCHYKKLFTNSKICPRVQKLFTKLREFVNSKKVNEFKNVDGLKKCLWTWKMFAYSKNYSWTKKTFVNFKNDHGFWTFSKIVKMFPDSKKFVNSKIIHKIERVSKLKKCSCHTLQTSWPKNGSPLAWAQQGSSPLPSLPLLSLKKTKNKQIDPVANNFSVSSTNGTLKYSGLSTFTTVRANFTVVFRTVVSPIWISASIASAALP